MGEYYVYMLQCQGNRIYTGYTVELLERFKAHQQGKGAKFTRAFKPQKILFYTKVKGLGYAMSLEGKIKSLSRAQKIDLINSEKNMLLNRKQRRKFKRLNRGKNA